MKLSEGEDNHLPLARFSSIKEALFFPWARRPLEIPGDEIGLCYSLSGRVNDPVKRAMRLCQYSSYGAEDKRRPFAEKRLVGFQPLRIKDIAGVLWSYYEDGLAAPRRGVIDANEALIKLAGVVVVGGERGVLLVPRSKNEKILPGAATVSVMESLTPWDIAQIFGSYGHLMMTTGDPPRERFPDNDFSYFPRGWELPIVTDIILRGAREEIRKPITPERLTFVGVVGGAKDLGLVWYYHAGPEEFEEIRDVHSGIVVNPELGQYHHNLERFGLKPDGWTEAILKFMELHGPGNNFGQREY
ncbi:MAG: hypothetical protein Q8N98_01225 [bacterium]|nr:hypothetical protein [bacterium]